MSFIHSPLVYFFKLSFQTKEKLSFCLSVSYFICVSKQTKLLTFSFLGNKMDNEKFCRELPKIELHAHLNGSLSQATMLQLKRYHADKGLEDKTDAFFDEFQIGSGDTRNLSDCFQVFGIAHALTSTPETLAMATILTLEEFQVDGCCYIELRSTPRETEFMTKRQYLETLVQTIQQASQSHSMISKVIVSLNRSYPIIDAEEISQLAIEFYKSYPDVVVGIEISGNPMVGKFEDFIPCLNRVKAAGLKVTLHCGEVFNPEEVLAMLKYKPDRIGHGICIHPQFGGTYDTWSLLCQTKVPVEICLTSNVNTKSTPDYDSHHFKVMYDAGIPLIICTDDKGVFQTSLTQEYMLCAETFNLTQSQLARMSLNASQFIFSEHHQKLINDVIQNFINKNDL